PRWPSAGPIGGLVFALPAGTCSLMNPITFFAISISSCGFQRTLRALPVTSSSFPRKRESSVVTKVTGPASAGTTTSRFLNLREIELYRSRAAEDRDRHPQLALLVVHVLHVAVKVGERSFLDAHRLTHLEQHFGPRLLNALLH